MKSIITYPPVDLTQPFNTLSSSQIDIYFHYTNEIGKATCKAKCNHCYLKTVDDFSVPFDVAADITDALKVKWYNIWLTPPDTFADWFLEKVRQNNMNNSWWSAFRLEEMGLAAWTSGKPLILWNPFDKLQLAYDCGYRSITLSPHDAAWTFVPITWFTKWTDVTVAIGNIQERNKHNPDKVFAITTTFTLGKHNNNFESMDKMAQWWIANNINLPRFNCFANFLQKDEHKVYEMSKDDIRVFWGNLLMLQEKYINEEMKFGLSEDWWDAFINDWLLQYLDDAWKDKWSWWCRAGYRLFAMIQRDNDIIIVWCVDNRSIWSVLGRVLQWPQGYDIDRNMPEIERLRQAIVSEKLYSCFGGVWYKRQDFDWFWADSRVEWELLSWLSLATV